MRTIELRVLCEGSSELNFVRQTLAPYLKSKQVFARAELLTPGQGGIVPYDKLRKAIQADVGRSKSHQYITTMIDLYAIGRYPEAASKPNESPYERVDRIERGMVEGLPNPRFIPYVQLHEFEALVLVDVGKIAAQFPGGEAADAADALRRSIGSTAPELVNDGPESAPSKRIIRFVPRYKNLKSVTGPEIIGAIGLNKLREACPHFNEWISRLESLSDES